ncbi:PE domain-containing protein [Mycobacterium camsae]|uniref:PE domain-containing protein n=1 Tax=Mycobacterium gordonae TaxID=1778 RepID=UPI00197D540D
MGGSAVSLFRDVPEAVTAALGNVESVKSVLRIASDAAVCRNTAIAPRGAGEITSATTRLFGSASPGIYGRQSHVFVFSR